MKKKGALSLSITAIVVIVIAFVVLGLALTLTKLIFKEATGKIPGAIALTDLEAEPSSEKPITISQTVEIGRNDEKTMSVGFYNKEPSTAWGATFVILECLRGTNKYIDDVPQIASISQDVTANTPAPFSLILTEQGLIEGNYICTIAAVCNPDAVPTGQSCPADGKPYESKQFFLKVVS